MDILEKIERNWREWDLETKNENLLFLYETAKSNIGKKKKGIILPISIFEILLQNIKDDNSNLSQELKNKKFLSIRILIHSEILNLEKYQDELIISLIQCLLDKNPPISDSATWLLNLLGFNGAEKLFERSQNSLAREKSILLGWLGRNMHISYSKEFENKVFKVWLKGLSDNNWEIKRSCLIALNDNSPWRVESIRSFKSAQNYLLIYSIILTTLEDLELKNDDSFAYWQNFYIEAINKWKKGR